MFAVTGAYVTCNASVGEYMFVVLFIVFVVCIGV